MAWVFESEIGAETLNQVTERAQEREMLQLACLQMMHVSRSWSCFCNLLLNLKAFMNIAFLSLSLLSFL